MKCLGREIRMVGLISIMLPQVPVALMFLAPFNSVIMHFPTILIKPMSRSRIVLFEETGAVRPTSYLKYKCFYNGKREKENNGNDFQQKNQIDSVPSGQVPYTVEIATRGEITSHYCTEGHHRRVKKPSPPVSRSIGLGLTLPPSNRR